MKLIYNWEKATVFDTEADGLLDEATKLHVLSCSLDDGNSYDINGDNLNKIKKFLEYHLNNEIPVIAHNGISYDIPLLEKMLDMDLSKLMVIDTLFLSWYLNIDRNAHGLGTFFDDYGFAKPPIDDWEGLTYEEYKFRCSSDVDINVALWEDLKARLIDMYTTVKECVDNGLVDNKRLDDGEVCSIDFYKGDSVEEWINRILTFLMYKADSARLREKTRIKIDTHLVNNTLNSLASKLKVSQKILEEVMPQVPDYRKKKAPAKPFLQSGDLSKSGESWNIAIDNLSVKDELGNYLSIEVEGDTSSLKVLKEYNPPNINSSLQIKDWLFKNGWKPTTFKYVKDEVQQQAWVDSGFAKELKPKPRLVPQINKEGDNGKELCESVTKLAEEIPEIMSYANYTLLKHRHDLLKGMKENLSEGGYLQARVGGMANTLREKHREIVNLPSVNKPYGTEIRGSLTCEDDQILIGSDLSSLEDRIKNHFCLAFDRAYVDSVNKEGYDPHLGMCVIAGMITQEEYDDWTIRGIKSDNAKAKRPLGKTANYSLIYGSAAETLARDSGMPLSDAKALYKAYWEVHWYVKAIAKDQYTFHCSKGKRWLINPINGFCYSVRSEKDIFSTLVQGTGSFCFDMWIDNIITTSNERWGKSVLSLLMHDEYMSPLKDTPKARELMEKLTFESIEKVNKDYKLRIDLGCDVQFGKTYADIH